MTTITEDGEVVQDAGTPKHKPSPKATGLKATFEFSWRPFQGPAGDDVQIVIRADDAASLALAVKAALSEVGPLLRESYGYEWKPKLLKEGKLVNPAATTPGEPAVGSGSRGRRRGRGQGGTPSANGNKPEEGSFEVAKIAVQYSQYDTSKMYLEVRGIAGELIRDSLPAGRAAWQRYFPEEEREDWYADMGEPGTLYDIKQEDPPLRCFWRRKGDYQNIVRFEYIEPEEEKTPPPAQEAPVAEDEAWSDLPF